MNAVDDKTVVKEYFNATGFDRWRKIYGTESVNKVQLDIRQGHQQTVDKVLDWLEADGNLQGLPICDAGCGVGSLSIPLARAGAMVYGSDISQKMVAEAYTRAKSVLGNTNNVSFEARDLESLSGRYHTVVCLDVLIHYPQEQAAQMIGHLCSLADSRLILSFAPKTLALSMLKKVGELFPGPSKTTRAYQHREADIVKIIQANGFAIQREGMTSTRFYYSRLLEAIRQ
ncbi:magnesium protoporphyrin IX methyltransferase [Phormidium sp. CCY1219]|uniref:magnesium protoporphyrin IX methyltransferase n=1 Tax=Phormidium sp. CCY1219 TaxID=2886104 RepID=UPI002D1E51FE|nr:magnesium protoporphyrin IX methyltransferase [Phormidium sp. CCY1219]MEB3829584.1 magnesium protoporphyrin IX methyltransferase [Phormidium sp. CCY1219]